jgi:hypothetical protein
MLTAGLGVTLIVTNCVCGRTTLMVDMSGI